MREMKDSGIEWIGKIPKDWDFEKGKYHFSNKKIIPGVSSYKYQRLALTLKGVIKRDKDDSDGLQPKDFNTYQLLKKDELVFKLIDLQNVSTSRVGLAHDTGLVSPAYIVLHSKEDIFPRYIEKFYLSMWYREIFNALGDDGVRSSLTTTQLLNVLVPIPSLSEQQKIASFLDKKCSQIDSLRSNIEKQIEILDEYKKSIITEAVTKGLDPNVEMKDSRIQYIGQTPKEWKIIRLKNILTERNQRSVTGQEELLSVSQYYGVILSRENKNKTMTAKSLIGYKIVKKKDLVFNKLNPGLARFGNSSYNGITSPDFAVYIVNDKVCSARFLQYLLKTEKYVSSFKSIGLGVGDGFARLYTPQLFNYKISIPNKNEIDTITDFLDRKCFQIDSIISSKKQQLESLDDYKKSLIYEYVTGKKEVI